MQTFAILGAHPDISIEEIKAVSGDSPSLSSPTFAIYDDTSWNSTRLMEQLGGSQKIGTLVAELPANATPTELTDLFTEELLTLRESKVHFGISVYGEQKIVQKLGPEIHHLGIAIKQSLRAQEKSARYVMSKTPVLNAATILSNHLIEKGAEFIILATLEKLFIGKTEAIQNIDAWTKRDRERPRTNAKQGMLPPKLARIMLNLAGRNLANTTVLDPFCGSGTVLMEASLLGASRLVGGDISAQAIADTKANLVWAEKELGLHHELDLFAVPAEKLIEHLAPESIDILVTEPYLGKPRQGQETREQLEEAVRYLENLYSESFAALFPTLKPGARVIIASPVHFLDQEAYAVDTIDALERVGYKHLPFETSLLYRHEGQFVGRELLRFEKK